MTGIRVEGFDAAASRFERLPASLRENLKGEVARLSAKLSATIRDDFLSGGVLNDRSGQLRGSIYEQQVETQDGISAEVGSSLGVDSYAGYWEFGFDRNVLAHGVSLTRGSLREKLKKARARYQPRPSVGARHYAGARQQVQKHDAARAFIHPPFDAMRDEIVGSIGEAGIGAIREIIG